MSFGLSAAALGWIAAGTVAVGTIAAQSDASRKAANQAKDALNAQQARDAEQKAQVETGANQAMIANNRRRRAAKGLLADATTPMDGGSVLGSAAAGPGEARTIQPVGRSTLGGA